MGTQERVGIVGLGYVGLPLALAFAERGVDVVGVDADARKPKAIAAGESYLRHLPASRVAAASTSGKLRATTDFAELASCTAVLICVPTPLTTTREPDLAYVIAASESVAPHLRKGQVVSLESTTYPGTSREVMKPILEKGSGLVAGKDFALVFSPEREDPGNAHYSTEQIPKVIGGYTPACIERGLAVYSLAMEKMVPVSTLEAAEMTKLLENIFRAVNIAMVNELKMLAHRFTDAGMPIDINEVIGAAATKPFGFMPFHPGPGLGGHCIPIDPFYLTWKAREVDVATRFIELAGEINSSMPYYVTDRVLRALSDHGKGMRGAQVLMLGVAYKAEVDDARESPAFKLLKLLAERGAEVEYHDPYIPSLAEVGHGAPNLQSVPLTAERIAAADVVLVVTAHKSVDYKLVAANAQLVVDTRDAMRGSGIPAEKLVQA